MLLPHPRIFDNRLGELLQLSCSILLFGRCGPEDSRRHAANTMLQVLEVHVCSETRGAVLQTWIVPLRMSVQNCSIRVASVEPAW